MPSITDRKESINRYKDQVSSLPVSSTVDEISKFSAENYDFDPAHLDQLGEIYDNAKLTLCRYLKNACRVSNTNLIQNVFALIKKKNIDHSSLKWGVSMPQSKVDFGRFCAGFYFFLDEDVCENSFFYYDEVWLYVIQYLSYIDKLHFGWTCKRFFKLVNKDMHMRYNNESMHNFF